jgi:hypothetical protein
MEQKLGKKIISSRKILKIKKHTIRFSRRNISFDEVFSFGGFILDDGRRELLTPPPAERKIEFIGDSYTAAEKQ